ncbi:uncharacterized protein LOC111865542 isoform X5 [Cryptotermes secundus]|uniref:uncharacterized protein LOC111865542 isoform X5 n=1 Tax=Cryptotermes secundus TaxID=105785 RepID=UPI000CD7C0F4|nr:uncharacterized protein LOC111865542 isoform X5 [Cryptotermes secundus]
MKVKMRYQIQYLHKYRQVCQHLKIPCTNNYSTEVNSETKPEPKSWRKRWDQKEGEWYSRFKLFAPEKGESPDVVRALQSTSNFSIKAVRKWIQKSKREAEILDMRLTSCTLLYC